MSTLQALGAAGIRSLRKVGDLPGSGTVRVTLRVTKRGDDLLPKRAGMVDSRTKPYWAGFARPGSQH
jgi:hypothetical protein